jgi:hypothetical protein
MGLHSLGNDPRSILWMLKRAAEFLLLSRV